jgi:hypothetical protein
MCSAGLALQNRASGLAKRALAFVSDSGAGKWGRRPRRLAMLKLRVGLNDDPAMIARACEEVLLPSGLAEEAYKGYAIVANRSTSYLASYRAIMRKYPHKGAGAILPDLLAARLVKKGKWFAAARETGLLGLAIELANRSPCDPRTLARAARDSVDENPAFALQVGLAALRWLGEGYGYEIYGRQRLDGLFAYDERRRAARENRRSSRAHRRTCSGREVRGSGTRAGTRARPVKAGGICSSPAKPGQTFLPHAPEDCLPVHSSPCVRSGRSRVDGLNPSKAFPAAGRSTRARATHQPRAPDACSLPVATDKASAHCQSCRKHTGAPVRGIRTRGLYGYQRRDNQVRFFAGENPAGILRQMQVNVHLRKRAIANGNAFPCWCVRSSRAASAD